VGTHPARRLWAALEPLHDVVYFADGVRPAGIALGLGGFWMTYFAFRAAPLGPVPAPPVIAVFAGFHPAMVAKALPDAWSRTTPAACIEARAAVSTAALREVGVDPQACERAARLLGPVAAAADPTGRPLFAANAALALPGDPVGRLWQLAATLREHRGDGHIAALVSEGNQRAGGASAAGCGRPVPRCADPASARLAGRGLGSRSAGTAAPWPAHRGQQRRAHLGRPRRAGGGRGAH